VRHCSRVSRLLGSDAQLLNDGTKTRVLKNKK
jgi:hypothetical protein